MKVMERLREIDDRAFGKAPERPPVHNSQVWLAAADQPGLMVAVCLGMTWFQRGALAAFVGVVLLVTAAFVGIQMKWFPRDATQPATRRDWQVTLGLGAASFAVMMAVAGVIAVLT